MKTYLTFGILVLYALLGVNVVNLSAEENWTRKADMPTQRYNFDTCIVNGKIFASGGEVDKFGDISIATVEMYDPKTDTWERKADMPTARSGVSTSVVDGKIYAIGGAEVNKTKEILYRRVFDEIHTTFFSPLSNIYLLTLPRLKSWDSCFFIRCLPQVEVLHKLHKRFNSRYVLPRGVLD